MTVPTPVGFLDFFILEASEYVEQLDGLLDAGGAAGPNADEIQRVARALRGSATMAKLPTFSEVAAGIERVGRAMREAGLRWDPELSAVVVAAVDDAKLLLRQVRSWGDAEDTRARARVAELAKYAASRMRTPMASPGVQSHESFLATESANIGAGLELVATRPSDSDAAANVLRRVRALRGIASVKDHPPLPDVLESAEHAARPLEATGATLGAERIALLSAAATVLRGIAAGIRSGSGQAPAADVAQFASALEALQQQEIEQERVLPIAELFYGDGGPTVVEVAEHPVTTPEKRFRHDVIGYGEHLRRLVADAREAHDDLSRERVRRALHTELRQLKESALSYGERDVASIIGEHDAPETLLESASLDTLDKLATALSAAGLAGLPVLDRIAGLSSAARRPTPVRPSEPAVTPRLTPEPRHVPAVTEMAGAMLTAAVSQATSAASRLGDLLDAGIKNLGALSYTPLSVPKVMEEQAPVPIDALLYRGKSAIERCVEIRDEARGRGGALDDEAKAELFDLLDLALAG